MNNIPFCVTSSELYCYGKLHFWIFTLFQEFSSTKHNADISFFFFFVMGQEEKINANKVSLQSIPVAVYFLLIISKMKLFFWMLSNLLFLSLFPVTINNCLVTACFNTWTERKCCCDQIRNK